MQVIETEGLTKVYANGVTAVSGIDLHVRRGEIFGLLGPNGAGKTTTIGMLTTRVIPTAGRARVAGVDVRANPVAVKRLIGVVPQTNTLDRGISVRDNLVFHCRYFGMGRHSARRRADELLTRFRLSERATSRVDVLSGGMAQRLMVARALAHSPAVLFLDEPTTGLDPQSRLALWELLTELHEEGQTILLTTHYMEEADRLSDRVAVMDAGHILALDSPKELKRAIDHATLVRVSAEGHLPDLAGLLGRVPGVARAEAHDGAIHVSANSSDGLLYRLVVQAEHHGWRISDVSVTEPTLETVFIVLTGEDLRE
ncbi:MAG: ABC transporter ATP-binding protein [Egibacteraceae bacterium]